jgi:hypothetical protein
MVAALLSQRCCHEGMPGLCNGLPIPHGQRLIHGPRHAYAAHSSQAAAAKRCVSCPACHRYLRSLINLARWSICSLTGVPQPRALLAPHGWKVLGVYKVLGGDGMPPVPYAALLKVGGQIEWVTSVCN